MCQRRASTTFEERLLIQSLTAAGWTAGAIGDHLHLCAATVRKWRRLGKEGRAALAPVPGRPRSGPLGAVTPHEKALAETITRLRKDHPGWGPQTLLAELARLPRFAHAPLPSRSTLARFLKAQGLCRRYERHVPLASAQRASTRAPHEEWEMDARGHSRLEGVGVVTLVNLNDRQSRLRLLSYPFLLGESRATRHLATDDYLLALRLAFTSWGRPEKLFVDHESVFADRDSSSPFPTRFHLWLVALGVELGFSRVRRPTDQALTEGSHRLWEAQVLLGQRYHSLEHLFQALEERREFLNRHLPCRALQNRPPLLAHPEAKHSGREYRPEWEEQLLSLERVRTYLAGGQWYRKVSASTTVRLGDQVYYLGRAFTPGSQAEITFDPADTAEGRLVFTSQDGQSQARHALKGVSKLELMGDLARIVSVPGYQPSLPFSCDEERLLRLCETIA